jgi:hypothetical protein
MNQQNQPHKFVQNKQKVKGAVACATAPKAYESIVMRESQISFSFSDKIRRR